MPVFSSGWGRFAFVEQVKVEKMKKKRKPKKKPLWRTLLIVLLCVCGMLLVGTTGLNIRVLGKAKPGVKSQEDARGAVAIVLGAKVTGDTPSLMLRDRLDVALNLYNAGHVEKVLVTGDGMKTSYNETRAMKSYLLNKGVDDDDIWVDNAGLDTYSSMYRALHLFEIKDAVVVTQEYHLSRAVYYGKMMGMNIEGVACDRYISPKLPVFIAREIIARCKAVYDTEIVARIPLYMEKNIEPNDE